MQKLRSQRGLFCVVWVAVASCGGGSTAPSAPTTPTGTTATAPANTWSSAGSVIALDSGAPIAGATLTPGWSLAAVTTNANGAYLLGDVANPPTTPYPVTISADGMLAHKAWILWARGPRTGVDISLIHNAAPFSLDFYKQFVRGTYDQPNAPYPVLRLTSAPKFYIRTLLQTGAPVNQPDLDVVVDAINRAVPAFTGGRFTPGAIELGTEVRPPTAGWITVDIKKESSTRCGQSYVGEDPGNIVLWEDTCSCARIPGNVVMHEVGHALGFFHVSDKASVMSPEDTSPSCRGELSAAERFHANVAYSRPRLNADPDDDPSAGSGILDNRRYHIVLK